MNQGIEKVEILRCKYCKSEYSHQEHVIEEHLKVCLMNPDNKSCVGCKHVMKVISKTGHTFKCNKKQQELTEKDLYMTGAECYEQREDLPMPIEHTAEYTEHLKTTTKKIQQTISDKE